MSCSHAIVTSVSSGILKALDKRYVLLLMLCLQKAYIHCVYAVMSLISPSFFYPPFPPTTDHPLLPLSIRYVHIPVTEVKTRNGVS